MYLKKRKIGSVTEKEKHKNKN